MNSLINKKYFIILLVTIYNFISTSSSYASFAEDLSRTDSGKELLQLNPQILNDIVENKINNNAYSPIFGRDVETQQVLQTLVRIKGKNPVLVGDAGVGKTAIAEKIAELIVMGLIPQGRVFQQELANAQIMQFDATSIRLLNKKPDAAALAFVRLIKSAEMAVGKPIIIFIDEIHSLEQEMWDVLKPSMDAADNYGIKLIGASTQREFQYAFGNDEALMRRFAVIGVSEFTEVQTIDLIKMAWLKRIETKYDVEISDETLRKVVKYYKKVLPDVARPDGPIKVLVDVSIHVHADNRSKVTTDDFFNFVQKKTQLPANPQDVKKINELMSHSSVLLREQVIGQNTMIESGIDLFKNLILSSGDRPQVGLILGPTGIGKTYFSESLSEILYGGQHRFFRIDGAAFSSEMYLTGLLGPRPGTVGYKETLGSGTLVEWMQNPGKGKYGGVLLIDEIEKMHPTILKELVVNLFDTGSVTSGNGRQIHVSNLLILCTSNHAMNIIFPPGYEKWSQQEIDSRIREFNQKALKDLFLMPTSADKNFILPPEIVNRIGQYILASPLGDEGAFSIAKLEFAKRKSIFLDRNNMSIEVSDDVVRFLTQQVYNKEDGVRDLSRAIDQFFNEVTKLSTDKSIRVDLLKEGARKNWIFLVNTSEQVLRMENHFWNRSQDLSQEDFSRLRNLEFEVNQEIFGQEELVSRSIRAVRQWLLLPSQRPLTVLTVGSTGTGKTETAKVLAKKLYGSENKAQIIPMGDIGRVEDLTKIFGASPQYTKSDQMGLFEKALIQLIDGGILVLDEISNVGGVRNSNEKTEILLRFYNILEEGAWSSPNTGRSYDLSKIVVWMTGNDLQEHYYGVTNDDMRETIYKNFKSESVIRQELRKNGFPEALLGRIQVVSHTKPLIDQVKYQISQKIVQEGFKKIQTHYPEMQVIISEDIVKKASQIFFSHGEGGRSLRIRFENDVQGLIAQSLLESDTTTENSHQRSIKIDLIDQTSSKYYQISGVTEAIFLRVQISERENGQIITTVENNLLESFGSQVKPISKELIKTAFHEVGHALLTNTDSTGMALRFVTIKPGYSVSGAYAGYAGYDEVKDMSRGLKSLESTLVRIVAGRVAQIVGGFEPDIGWGSDFQKMKSMIGKYLVEKGLEPRLWGSNLDTNGNLVGSESQKKFFETFVREKISAAEIEAKNRIEKEVSLLRFLVAQLVRYQSLSGDEFRLLTRFYRGESINDEEKTILKEKFRRTFFPEGPSCKNIFMH